MKTNNTGFSITVFAILCSAIALDVVASFFHSTLYHVILGIPHSLIVWTSNGHTLESVIEKLQKITPTLPMLNSTNNTFK